MQDCGSHAKIACGESWAYLLMLMMNDEDYYFGDYMAVGMSTEESWPCRRRSSAARADPSKSFGVAVCWKMDNAARYRRLTLSDAVHMLGIYT
jgi:hypothetical protein